MTDANNSNRGGRDRDRRSAAKAKKAKEKGKALPSFADLGVDDTEAAVALAKCEERLREGDRKDVESTFLKGAAIAEGRMLCGSQKVFAAWTGKRCNLTRRGAENYEKVHVHLSGYRDRLIAIGMLRSSMYELAEGSEEKVEAVLDTFEAGTKMTAAQIKAFVDAGLEAEPVAEPADMGGPEGIKAMARLKLSVGLPILMKRLQSILAVILEELDRHALGKRVSKGQAADRIEHEARRAKGELASLIRFVDAPSRAPCIGRRSHLHPGARLAARQDGRDGWRAWPPSLGIRGRAEGMSDRFESFLLKRLRRQAARDAVDLALTKGWLADEDEQDTEPDEGSSGRRGHYFLDDDDDDPRRSSVRKLKLGPKLEGLSGDGVARLLARDGVPLDPPFSPAGQQAVDDSSSRSASSSSLLVSVLPAIRAAAAPPPVEEIAVALLLAQGLARSCVSEEKVLLVLRSPRPIVSLVCPVPGFERLFVKLLRAGLIVPRAIATGIGQDVRGQHLPFTGNTDKARRVIVFAGRRFESDDGAERADLQLGIAATLGHPLIAVAENPERIPTPLRVAASLDLDCGHLTAELIGKVMAEALGPLPSGLPIDDLDADCALLTLADLSLAIREGVSHQRAIGILERLGHARRIAAEDDDDEDSGKSGSGSSSSGWRSSRDKAVKGSGSDIIKPVRPETIACDAFVPTIERLHGYGEARTWALDLKQDLELWREKKLDWSAISAKLLLSGPPGTGKTSFAKALCNTLQVPLIATSVSTWLEASYLGDVVRRMRFAFEEASSHAPCILFIDEIDGIGQRDQGKSYDDYWNTVVNKALELLDGAVRSSGIIIVGATNHPDVIDPALLRSGRLETHIRIPPPDIDALAGILRHHLGNDVARVIETRPRQAASGAVSTATAVPSAKRTAQDADLSRPSRSETDETSGPHARSPRGA